MSTQIVFKLARDLDEPHRILTEPALKTVVQGVRHSRERAPTGPPEKGGGVGHLPSRGPAGGSYRLRAVRNLVGEVNNPAVVRQLEGDLPKSLNFFNVPQHLRQKPRRANIDERAFAEVRRRTQPMLCYVSLLTSHVGVTDLVIRLQKGYHVREQQDLASSHV